MRISDWSSDVCSSDLQECFRRSGKKRSAIRAWRFPPFPRRSVRSYRQETPDDRCQAGRSRKRLEPERHWWRERTSVVEGKSRSVRVDLGGRCIIKQKEKEG